MRKDTVTTPELTGWFPAGVEPHHVGVYMTNANGRHVFQHWNGTRWGYFMPSASEAHACSHTASAVQTPRWCGVTKPLAA